MAGIFNWLGCIPIDTLKTKLQTAPEGTLYLPLFSAPITPSDHVRLMSSARACVVAATVSHLLQRFAGKYPNGIRSVFKDVIKNDGWRALYRGIGPILIRAFPANAACFLGVETAMKAMNYAGL